MTMRSMLAVVVLLLTVTGYARADTCTVRLDPLTGTDLINRVIAAAKQCTVGDRLIVPLPADVNYQDLGILGPRVCNPRAAMNFQQTTFECTYRPR